MLLQQYRYNFNLYTCMEASYCILASDYSDTHHSLDVWQQSQKSEKGLVQFMMYT